MKVLYKNEKGKYSCEKHKIFDRIFYTVEDKVVTIIATERLFFRKKYMVFYKDKK